MARKGLTLWRSVLCALVALLALAGCAPTAAPSASKAAKNELVVSTASDTVNIHPFNTTVITPD